MAELIQKLPLEVEMIERLLQAGILARLGDGKAIVVQGARQTGKTTLMKRLLGDRPGVQYLSGDEAFVRQQLGEPDLARLRSLVGQSPVLFLDEAQRIPDIGLTLKLLTDHFPGLQLLVTGSSALELTNRVHEPLTGRKWEFTLFPLCWQELVEHFGAVEARRQLEQRLLYGMYPEVVSRPGIERGLLLQLSGDNLTQDLLAWQGIRKPELLSKLLQALALQVGSMVSYNELANLLKVSRTTVTGYLDLLEKSHIVSPCHPGGETGVTNWPAHEKSTSGTMESAMHCWTCSSHWNSGRMRGCCGRTS
jgi:predicted AAA+ superfamily ATPase